MVLVDWIRTANFLQQAITNWNVCNAPPKLISHVWRNCILVWECAEQASTFSSMATAARKPFWIDLEWRRARTGEFCASMAGLLDWTSEHCFSKCFLSYARLVRPSPSGPPSIFRLLFWLLPPPLPWKRFWQCPLTWAIQLSYCIRFAICFPIGNNLFFSLQQPQSNVRHPLDLLCHSGFIRILSLPS